MVFPLKVRFALYFSVSFLKASGMVSGKKTLHSISAASQYAAADIPAFPAEGRQIVLTPCAFAIVTAKAIPLSLKDPVGFTVSSFT